MKKVYSSQDPLAVANLRNLLLQEGIETEVQIPFLAAASGDLPFTECWSQLWVVDDGNLERAAELIAEALKPHPGASKPWRCSRCGEPVEGQFDACWKCGSIQPDGEP